MSMSYKEWRESIGDLMSFSDVQTVEHYKNELAQKLFENHRIFFITAQTNFDAAFEFLLSVKEENEECERGIEVLNVWFERRKDAKDVTDHV